MFTLKSLAGFLAIVTVCAAEAIAQNPAPPQPGDVVFQTDFDSPTQQAYNVHIHAGEFTFAPLGTWRERVPVRLH